MFFFQQKHKYAKKNQANPSQPRIQTHTKQAMTTHTNKQTHTHTHTHTHTNIHRSAFCHWGWGSGVLHTLFTDDSKFYIYWKIYGLEGCDKSDNTDASYVASTTRLYLRVWIYFHSDFDSATLNLLSQLAYWIRYKGPSLGFTVKIGTSDCMYSTWCTRTQTSNAVTYTAESCVGTASCVTNALTGPTITTATANSAIDSYVLFFVFFFVFVCVKNSKTHKRQNKTKQTKTKKIKTKIKIK